MFEKELRGKWAYTHYGLIIAVLGLREDGDVRCTPLALETPFGLAFIES